MGDTWRNIILVLKLIVDYKHQKYRNSQRSGKKPPSKSPNKGDGQYWSVLPLAQKMFYITNVSCRFFVCQPSYLRLQKGACGKQKAWMKKRKYASFLWFRVFPLQLFPLQLFQDHHDGNVEASGIVMTCFHQAVPISLQVVILSETSEEREHGLVESEIWNLNMRIKWGLRSYPLPMLPSSCGVRVQHCSMQWCPAGCVLDAECDGAVGGWFSVPVWRLLLQ
jgi:hypothetical protein